MKKSQVKMSKPMLVVSSIVTLFFCGFLLHPFAQILQQRLADEEITQALGQWARTSLTQEIAECRNQKNLTAITETLHGPFYPVEVEDSTIQIVSKWIREIAPGKQPDFTDNNWEQTAATVGIFLVTTSRAGCYVPEGSLGSCGSAGTTPAYAVHVTACIVSWPEGKVLGGTNFSFFPSKEPRFTTEIRDGIGPDWKDPIQYPVSDWIHDLPWDRTSRP